MPVFVLTESQFRDRCYCPCDTPFFLGEWGVYFYTGMVNIPSSSSQDIVLKPVSKPAVKTSLSHDVYPYLTSARYDKVEATLDKTWKFSEKESIAYRENSGDPYIFTTYEKRFREGSESMSLQLNYVGPDKVTKLGTQVYDPDPLKVARNYVNYHFGVKDYIGSTYDYTETVRDRKHYIDNATNQFVVYTSKDIIRTKTWEVRADGELWLVEKEIGTSTSYNPTTGLTTTVLDSETEEIVNYDFSFLFNDYKFSNLSEANIQDPENVTESGIVSKTTSEVTRNYNLGFNEDNETLSPFGDSNNPTMLPTGFKNEGSHTWSAKAIRTTPNRLQVWAIINDDETFKFAPASPTPVQLVTVNLDGSGDFFDGYDAEGNYYINGNTYDPNTGELIPDGHMFEPATNIYTPPPIEAHSNNGSPLTFIYGYKDPNDPNNNLVIIGERVAVVFSEEWDSEVQPETTPGFHYYLDDVIDVSRLSQADLGGFDLKASGEQSSPNEILA